MWQHIDVERRWKPPGSTWAFIEDTSVRLDTLSPGGAVFLVGDPGSGKTATVRKHVDSSPKARLFSFADVSSKASVTRWLEDCFSEDCELFLDAYDEKSSSFRRSFLVDPLRDAVARNCCPSLRIVSRGTHLPKTLVDEVRRIVGAEESVDLVYQLVPLTTEQIKVWVRLRIGDDSSRFFSEVQEKQLYAFLSRPADLEAFLKVFNRDAVLGNTPTDAWKAAVQMELEEPNLDRQDIQCEIGAKHSISERYKAAQIIAMAHTLCECGPLVLDSHGVMLPRNALTIDSLRRDSRLVFPDLDQQQFNGLIRETSQSRPFENGADGVVFASSAKAQFLAAQYLLGTNPKQILNLLKDNRSGTRIPERAQPIAAEVAKFEPSLFEWICRHQPEVLLKGVVLDYNTSQRKQITEALLARRQERNPWLFAGFALAALAHPGLASQLRPYLNGAAGNQEDVNLAIDIAEYAKCSTVSSELAAIATDRDRDYETRANAAQALASIGGAASEKLRPLLLQPPQEDVRDELLSSVLIGLWPQGFAPKDAFKVFRKPNNPASPYTRFLGYYANDPLDRITRKYLIPGLEWLLEQEEHGDQYFDDEFAALRRVITVLAWEHLDDPKVAALLARVVDTRLNRHVGEVLPFRERAVYRRVPSSPGLEFAEFLSNVKKRTILFRAWLAVKAPKSSWSGIHRFFSVEEISVLLDEVARADSSVRAFLINGVTNYVCLLIRGDRTDELDQIAPQIDELAIGTASLREEIKHEALREACCESVRPQSEFPDRKHHASILEALADGDPAKFPLVAQGLLVDNRGWGHGDYYDPGKLERWQRLTVPEKNQLLAMAKAFAQLPPSRRRPRKEYRETLHDWAGVSALLTIAYVEPDWLRLRFDSVRPWLPHALEHHCSIGNQIEASKPLFLGLTKEEIASELRVQLAECTKDLADPFQVRAFNELWRDEVGPVIARASRQWNSGLRKRVLVLLLFQRYSDLVQEVRIDLVSRSRERRLFAVRLILNYGLGALYSQVSELALKDVEIREVVWDQLWNNDRFDPGRHIEQFDIELLAEFFERAITRQPPVDDVESRSGPINQQVTRQNIRNSFATSVSKKRNSHAWELLDEWSTRPGLAWLQKVAQRSRQEWLEEAWSPPTIAALVRLSLDSRKRYIATANDLHQVVCDALESIRSTAETQQAYWQKAGIPATEPSITRNLAELLRPHLVDVVVNSEVGCFGGRTDIQIETVVSTALEEPMRLKCVIEAKRFNNEDLKKALETQLVATYLPPHGEHTGIYLVLWFEGLGPDDAKRDEIQKLLEHQAKNSKHKVSVMHFDIQGSGNLRRAAAKISKGIPSKKNAP